MIFQQRIRGIFESQIPIESTFATVILRTAKVRNCYSREIVVTMGFQLCMCARKRWKRLNRFEQLATVIESDKFENGIEVEKKHLTIALGGIININYIWRLKIYSTVGYQLPMAGYFPQIKYQ